MNHPPNWHLLLLFFVLICLTPALRIKAAAESELALFFLFTVGVTIGVVLTKAFHW